MNENEVSNPMEYPGYPVVYSLPLYYYPTFVALPQEWPMSLPHSVTYEVGSKRPSASRQELTADVESKRHKFDEPYFNVKPSASKLRQQEKRSESRDKWWETLTEV